MILVDTSAWVDYLRGSPTRATRELRRLLGEAPTEVAICEPIAMELLAGAANPTLGKIETLVDGLARLEFEPLVDFRAGAMLYRAARAHGRTVWSLLDCTIAAVAVRHGVPLIHKDADFEVLAEVSALESHSLR